VQALAMGTLDPENSGPVVAVGRSHSGSSVMVLALPVSGVVLVSIVVGSADERSSPPWQRVELGVLSPLLLSVSESESWQQSQLMFCCVASILTSGPPFRQAATSPVLLTVACFCKARFKVHG